MGVCYSGGHHELSNKIPMPGMCYFFSSYSSPGFHEPPQTLQAMATALRYHPEHGVKGIKTLLLKSS